jgi:hypothetical protein
MNLSVVSAGRFWDFGCGFKALSAFEIRETSLKIERATLQRDRKPIALTRSPPCFLQFALSNLSRKPSGAGPIRHETCVSILPAKLAHSLSNIAAPSAPCSSAHQGKYGGVRDLQLHRARTFSVHVERLFNFECGKRSAHLVLGSSHAPVPECTIGPAQPERHAIALSGANAFQKIRQFCKLYIKPQMQEESGQCRWPR